MNEVNDYPAYIDRYDVEVVSRMDIETIYHIETIRKAYKEYTEISRDRTAKERTESLVKSPAFENTGIGRFRYIGCMESDIL